ncbi:MAG: hypothetical protein C3F02_01190 [Parcubacteria group bacterium]|nr:MAG: hypothetical protein C3F02_01190 [Parcubacteria group bacterium]
MLPLLQKVKSVYLLWFGYYKTLPKTQRYTLGQKIDTLFTEAIEVIVTASFLTKIDKLPYVRRAVQKMDTIKIFLMMLWESKTLDNKKYIALSIKINEVGKMLGGWQGQLLKQNSPNR